MKEFSSHDEWIELLAESMDRPVIIFKHSNTCPISAAAHQRVTSGIDSKELKLPVHKLVVQNAPELKMEISKDLNIQHESPQIIVLKNGEPIYHSSHGDIQVADIIRSSK